MSILNLNVHALLMLKTAFAEYVLFVGGGKNLLL